MNLVGNGLDACTAAGFGPQKPGGRVCVRVEALPGGGTSYSVADNGCGIPERERASLFTAFFSTKGAGGSGLGLMTTRKTVEAHGGSLHITSEENVGSEFTILIPVNYENKVLQ